VPVAKSWRLSASDINEVAGVMLIETSDIPGAGLTEVEV
jgi:hypothetical protein